MSQSAAVDQVLESVAADLSVDRATLARLLEERPGPEGVVALLSGSSAYAVRAAVIYLGLYGSFHDSPLLALCLQHEDDGVAQLAEHCLWSIWMQAGTPDGNRRLAEGIERIRVEDYARALGLLDTLIAREPLFAEARFQRGLVLSSIDEPHDAAEAYHETLRLNPYHFGAVAALGHVSVEIGELSDALRHYERALRIHPRLMDVRRALREVRRILLPRDRFE